MSGSSASNYQTPSSNPFMIAKPAATPPPIPNPAADSQAGDAAAAQQRKIRGAADTIFAGKYQPGTMNGGGNPYSTRMMLGS